MITSHIVKKYIRTQSKTLNINPNIVLRMIMFDFFLEKLDLSRFSDKFVIKGGFLISSTTKINLRTTMDLDITLKGLPIDQQSLTKCLEEILSIKTIDNLDMSLAMLNDIRDSADYPGVRATINILYDGIKETLKIDFTTGDIMTPSEVLFSHRTFVESKILSLKSYNYETIIAEKLETIITRSTLNTRMRDFYDIYILWKLTQKMMKEEILEKAFIETMNYRNSLSIKLDNILQILINVENDLNIISLWKSYQNSYPYAKDVQWNKVIESISTILSNMSNLQ